MTGRREFLGLIGGGALIAAGGDAFMAGCGKRARASGTATSAAEVSALVPRYKAIELVPPDIRGEGLIADGYRRYPKRLVRAVERRPGTSGRPIKTMSPWWGPTPPGLGRNSFLDAVNAELGIAVNPSVQDGATYSDKLGAILGARDVPDVLCAPNWDIDKIPRFSQAVKALFADLTEHLKGDAVDAYPMLATLPTSAWQYSVWGGRLAAIPFPTDNPLPWALFYRKDLTDAAGVAAPKTIDELYAFGKRLTDPAKGVWAFGNVFNMIQMLFRCPHSATGWRRKARGGLEYKYEISEYRDALEFTARLFRDGFVHPDLVASKGGDARQLFNAGKMLAYEEGPGAWYGMQSEQSKVTPGYNVQPVPIFSAIGGEPLSWGVAAPVFYSFIKKGLGRERTQEILRVLDWCAAPFGSTEYELYTYGVENKHFTRGGDGGPIPTELGRKEISGQYTFLGGRAPVVVGGADVPNYVDDFLGYVRATMRYLEPDLFEGIKVELPSNFSKVQVPTEDKIADILRGRRPLTDLAQVVREWRTAGGDEGREFLEKTLAANGR